MCSAIAIRAASRTAGSAAARASQLHRAAAEPIRAGDRTIGVGRGGLWEWCWGQFSQFLEGTPEACEPRAALLRVFEGLPQSFGLDAASASSDKSLPPCCSSAWRPQAGSREGTLARLHGWNGDSRGVQHTEHAPDLAGACSDATRVAIPSMEDALRPRGPA